MIFQAVLSNHQCDLPCPSSIGMSPLYAVALFYKNENPRVTFGAEYRALSLCSNTMAGMTQPAGYTPVQGVSRDAMKLG